MNKKIISALMAAAMCVSAMPMAVYAEDDTTETTIEYLEFTQKFCDRVLLNPDENEDNRILHNYFSHLFADRGDAFLGLTKNESGSCEPYYLRYAENNATVPNHDDIKVAQYIEWGNYTYSSYYKENPYITEEEYYALDGNEQLMKSARIFEETGEVESIAHIVSTELYRYPYYVGEDGKAYNHNGEELVIINGEVVVAPEKDDTPEVPAIEYLEFTQKFCDEVLLHPDDSEENRLIHNYFKHIFESRGDTFLGLDKNHTDQPYTLRTAEDYQRVPNHSDIKVAQYIQWENYTDVAYYKENPYITEKEFYALKDKRLTAAKIFDETGEDIAEVISTALYRYPYYVGEDGKGYNWKGEELCIFNGEVTSIYCNPNELNICDGESVYTYSAVYHGILSEALRADFYKYLEDNNAQQVYHYTDAFGNGDVYRTQNRGCNNWIEDISDELIITDSDGNVIPNDPNLLQVAYIQGVTVYVYEIHGQYVFEDEAGNRIVLSEYDDDYDISEFDGVTPYLDDSWVVCDFFEHHEISPEHLTTHIVEMYLADNANVLSAETLTGDANEDGKVSIGDAVLIMQALSNPDEFALTEQGAINADYNGDGSVTTADALAIQLIDIS